MDGWVYERSRCLHCVNDFTVSQFYIKLLTCKEGIEDTIQYPSDTTRGFNRIIALAALTINDPMNMRRIFRGGTK